MTFNPQETQAQAEQDQPKSNEKELNFRRQEEMYRRMLAEKEARIAEMERQMQQRSQPVVREEEEEEDDEPYVDKRRLNKKLSSFEKTLEEKLERKAEEKARRLLEEERKQQWMREHKDFYDIMNHAEKFAQQHPDLAEDILSMPEGFERQKLVYRNIKALKLHEPKTPESTIQQKIDQNRRTPYYQPSGVGSAPYQSSGDFSPQGQVNAYQKMQELKNRLRLG